MKTIKFFALALATLALVACEKKSEVDNPTGQDPVNPTEQVEKIEITPQASTIKVGETVALTATITPSTVTAEITWSSSNPEIATIDANGIVTAVAKGDAIIYAKAGGKQAVASVTVLEEGEKENDADENAKKALANLEAAEEVYVIVLDAQTMAKVENKPGYVYLGPDEGGDGKTNLWVWDNTYAAVDPTGFNFFGNTEGYSAWQVGTVGWSGAGINVGATNISKVTAMVEKIVAAPQDYVFHMALKSTQRNSNFFTIMDLYKFAIGVDDYVDNGITYKPITDITLDGEWNEIEIPMSEMTGLAAYKEPADGINLFCFLSGATTGYVLNYDAIYIYKK